MVDRFTVAVDGSDYSQAVALPLCRFAAPLSARAAVLSAVVNADDREQREARIRQALRAGGHEIEVTVVAEETPVADYLLGVARRYPDELLAMHTHARGAIGETVFGSVASRVMREAHVPIVLAGPALDAAALGELRTLLVCLDGSNAAESMAEPAATLARAADVDVSFIQVLSSEATASMVGTDSREYGYVKTMAEAAHRRWGVAARWEVLHGSHTGRAIVDYARGEPGALIAMTTHGRSGLSRLIMGSVANTVVQQATGPVLVMRPG